VREALDEVGVLAQVAGAGEVAGHPLVVGIALHGEEVLLLLADEDAHGAFLSEQVERTEHLGQELPQDAAPLGGDEEDRSTQPLEAPAGGIARGAHQRAHLVVGHAHPPQPAALDGLDARFVLADQRLQGTAVLALGGQRLHGLVHLAHQAMGLGRQDVLVGLQFLQSRGIAIGPFAQAQFGGFRFGQLLTKLPDFGARLFGGGAGIGGLPLGQFR
jgi:hypothetical protein